MNKELELWQFIADRLTQNQPVMLLVVAESSGSSPGRQGYKMAVGSDGELTGSIGGGVMEVNLVEQSRDLLSVPPAVAGGSSSPPYKGGVAEGRGGSLLSAPPAVAGGSTSFIKPQVHQKHAKNPSGMICSGKQTVIFRKLESGDLKTVREIINSLKNQKHNILQITPAAFSTRASSRRVPPEVGTQNKDFIFEKISDTDFFFQERLGHKNDLYIVGGGHCALALSELMSKMDFHITIFDDRPNLNTIDNNRFAHDIKIIDSYENIDISSGPRIYVVVMTLGYKSDEIVIRKLFDKDFKYFGVLGSKAKMAALFKSLKAEGFPAERLGLIHTPIGIPINSRTPEEIAVSIAAEIIAEKNKI